MTDPLLNRCKIILEELGLLPEDAAVTVTPLTGGVASDIAKVMVNDTPYCVKFALAKLRVKADWFAPVERNLAEYHWLKTAADIAPQTSVRLFGHSPKHNGFVMSYLDDQTNYLLKTALLTGQSQGNEAAETGKLLGQIHRASAKQSFDRTPFQNRDDFHALRLEPYLLFTANQHNDVRDTLIEMAEQLYENDAVLVHGDVSPKNIIISDQRPILLDAECATMGDGVFDCAFFLNHLILKAIKCADYREDYMSYCLDFWNHYTPFIDFEEKSTFEMRLTKLLPMLMLARVDGKSPVEYLNSAEQQMIRLLSLQAIKNPCGNIKQLISNIKTKLNNTC